MKKQITLSLLPLVGVLNVTGVLAQTAAWQTVDSYRAGPSLGASAGAIGTDASGGILYCVGSAIAADGTHMATVRASDDVGSTWHTLSQYLEPGWSWAHYRGFSPANGALFVSGEFYDPAIGKRWVVRRSLDQGYNWTTVDSPTFGAMGGFPSASDVQVSSTGEVYAAGTQGGGSSPYRWVVRKSSQAGDEGTWASVDAVGTIGTSEARSIAFNAAGAVFVAGRVANAQNGSATWTVRRSQNQGATWTTVDAYQETVGLNSGAEGIAITSGGTIYVTGFARGLSKGKYSDYWVVRRSSDGGSTWNNVDKSTSANGSFLSPTGLTLDAAGGVWVCGYTGSSTAPNQLIVRKGTTNSKGMVAWTASDTFQTGIGARANGITTDVSGNVFVTGRWVDSTENWWLTRKLGQ